LHLRRRPHRERRDSTFETGDDAIALSAHDDSIGNPELGWIEDGVIEDMHDLPNPKREVGYFCRILAGRRAGDVTYTAGVRNVVFRGVFLGKPRTAFSVHFDTDRYSRSYYPGVDTVTIANSTLRQSAISCLSNKGMTDYGKTRISLTGCIFAHPGALNLLINKAPGKQIVLESDLTELRK
jgi:hypothetical protein